MFVEVLPGPHTRSLIRVGPFLETPGIPTRNLISGREGSLPGDCRVAMEGECLGTDTDADTLHFDTDDASNDTLRAMIGIMANSTELRFMGLGPGYRVLDGPSCGPARELPPMCVAPLTRVVTHNTM